MNIRKDMVIGCYFLTRKILFNIEYINKVVIEIVLYRINNNELQLL